MHHHAAAALYCLGFALQIIGAVLVGLEIRDDVQAARRIAMSEAAAPATVRTRDVEIGGVLGQALAGAVSGVDSFREFATERLSGHMRRRLLGVALIIVGAAVGLAANLLALS